MYIIVIKELCEFWVFEEPSGWSIILLEEGIKCLEMISYDSVYLVDDLIYSLIATKDRSIYLIAKEVIVDITFLLRIKS